MRLNNGLSNLVAHTENLTLILSSPMSGRPREAQRERAPGGYDKVVADRVEFGPRRQEAGKVGDAEPDDIALVQKAGLDAQPAALERTTLVINPILQITPLGSLKADAKEAAEDGHVHIRPGGIIQHEVTADLIKARRATDALEYNSLWEAGRAARGDMAGKVE